MPTNVPAPTSQAQHLYAALTSTAASLARILSHGVPAKTARERIAVGALARTVDGTRATLLLVKRGLALEAGAVARVIVESAYKAAWAAESETRAQALIDEAERDFALLAEQWSGFGVSLSSSQKERASSARQRLLHKYGPGAMKRKKKDDLAGSGPWTPDGRTMARVIALDHTDEFYDLHFRSLCRFGHASIDSFVAAAMRTGSDLGPGVCMHVAVSLAALLSATAAVLPEHTRDLNRVLKRLTERLVPAAP